VISRDAINKNNRIVVVVPILARGTRKTELPSNVVLKAGEGGLTEESLAHGEQFRSSARRASRNNWDMSLPTL
jgi:Growth inhibitor